MGRRCERESVDSATIAAHLKEGLTANDAYADASTTAMRQGHRGRAEEGRGGVQHAFPLACHDGADEPRRCASPPKAPKSGCRRRTPKRRSRHCPLRRAAARAVRGVQQTLGGGFGRRGGTQDYVRQATLIAQAVSRHAGQADLEPRGRPDARFLSPISQCRMPGGLDEQAISRHCACASRASRSTPASRRHNIKDGKDGASSRAVRRRRATRRSVTPCRTC